MSSRALIVVDIQNDYFPGGKWPLSGVEAAADNAAQVIAAARAAGDLVVHVRHEFPSADAPFFVPGSEGAQIYAKVSSQDNEPVVLKHQINAFRDTELAALLASRAVKEVVIVGNMSHICIDAVTRAAVDFGYQATVIHDACAACDQQFNGLTIPAAHVHGAFMAALAFGYASVVSTREFLA